MALLIDLFLSSERLFSLPSHFVNSAGGIRPHNQKMIANKKEIVYRKIIA